jgi:hypothetical protein
MTATTVDSSASAASLSGSVPDRPRGGAATWYDVLDIGPGASPAEVRAAYDRSLALIEGRSLGGYFLLDPLAVEGARADLETAWAILSDLERRAAYDRALGLPASSLWPTPPPTMATTRASHPPSLKFLAPVLDDQASPAPPATAPTTTTPPPTTTTTTPTTTTPTTARSTVIPSAASPPPFDAALFSLEGEVNGQLLKRLREARGLSLDELAELTKIRRPYLQAIEDQDLENLPARVYLRGFLTQIARALRVDKTRLAEGYVAFVARFGG